MSELNVYSILDYDDDVRFFRAATIEDAIKLYADNVGCDAEEVDKRDVQAHPELNGKPVTPQTMLESKAVEWVSCTGCGGQVYADHDYLDTPGGMGAWIDGDAEDAWVDGDESGWLTPPIFKGDGQVFCGIDCFRSGIRSAQARRAQNMANGYDGVYEDAEIALLEKWLAEEEAKLAESPAP